MADARRIYRLMLRLYPARFREEYAGPLERQFFDEYREIASGWGRTRFWAAALADLTTSIPSAFAREIRQDLAFAARVHRQRMAVTGMALAALALAIGVTTGVFSVLNAVLLRSLPFRHPERLVEVAPVGGHSLEGAAAFAAWRRNHPYLQDAALYRGSPMNLNYGAASRRVRVAEVSANFFTVMGTDAEFGRTFVSGEDTPGGTVAAVLSHHLWENEFGGDPRLLGATVRLNGAPATVVGMAAPEMDFPDRADVWTATIFDFGRLPMEQAAFFDTTIARLKPGVTLTQADARIRAIDGRNARLLPLRDQLAGAIREASSALVAVVAMVLLIACANVAHLLLARTGERRHELVVRAALGASRARLVQQLVTESAVLTLVAAAAGLPVAWGAARLAAMAQPAALSAQRYTLLDWHVLAFTAAVALAMGLIFGVLPASLVGRLQPAGDLLRTQARPYGSKVRRWRGALLALQAAITVALLAGTVTMSRTFLRLTGTALGFRTSGVATFTVSLAGSRPQQEKWTGRFYRDVLERLRSTPGVEAAGAVEHLPLAENVFAALGYRLGPASPVVGANPNMATPGYFAALGMPLVEGRDFHVGDSAASAPVAVVTDELARRLSGGASVVGRNLYMANSSEARGYTIVGVVRAPRPFPGAPPALQVYRLVGQMHPEFLTFVLRVRGRAAPYLAVAREAVRQTDSSVAVYRATTLDSLLADSLARPRFYALAMTFFGGFALLLALIGLHGAVAHAIQQRTHEIGVRLALGSSPGGLRALMLGQSTLPVAAGIAAGVALARAYPLDGPTCAAAALSLSAAAAAAVWRATRRIVRMDPVSILRAD